MCIWCIFLICLISSSYCISDDEVEKFATYMKEEMRKAADGQLSKNSYSFKPLNNDPPKDFGKFDFIIVGAGATGTVLANRLSEEKSWKILLLEAGGYSNNYTAMPANLVTSKFTRFNWGYKSVPQKYSCLGMINEECLIPRGQGVGGTTLINSLMYLRGNKIDFDKWADLGNPGWAYKDVLPLFKKAEAIVKNNPEAVVNWTYHNASGPLHVEYKSTTDPQLDAWFKAQSSFGYTFSDPNSPEQIGFSPLPFNVKHGRRQDGGTVFILPILSRDNLKVQSKSLVTKIIFKESMFFKPHAKGIEFSYNGTLYKACAKKEVILSGGSINTPQLLMVSGIGPKKHLKNKNMKVIKNLPVGKTLREHPVFYGLLFSSNYSEPIKSFNEYIKEYLNGTGPFTILDVYRGVSFHKTKYENVSKYPDLEILYSSNNCTSPFFKKGFNWKNETYEATFVPLNPTKCFQVTPVALHSKSIGYVKLKTNSTYDFPLIDPNHLSDTGKRDINTLYEGIKLIINFTKTEAMQKFNVTIGVTPLPACKQHEFLSKEYWYCALGQMTYNLYHPVGTCPMGPDPKKYVVNHELKVHGIDKLRVADASVFPFTLSGHPNAPCVMIGEKLALLLKTEYL